MIAAKILEEQTTIEWLPINKISIDRTYQRTPSESKVKAISSKFNEISAGVLIVSIRDDGQTIIVDGQHRLEAMRKRGIQFARCQVCRGLSLEQESEIYIYCNTVRKSPDALDVFRARLITQDSVAIAITNIIKKHGLSISIRKGGKRPANTIWCVAALEEIYNRGKETLLEDVLTLALRSWPDEGMALEAKVLLGIAHFHFKYKGLYTHEEFIAKMNITDLNSLYRRAQYHRENGGHDRHAFSKALQEAYDKGGRTRRLETA